ncbi:zf-HC2 domain-containing protein [Streptomyces sp. NPDC097619]|uniref:anti-sigma factor family protein n=1 Tax=Streptomyces sp. NPDC097619 TaxID=3157228 RepID=UPI003331EC14
MSGVGPSPAEHHLGDRLAALVDGELSHDARERVLAHLATCARCKSEADAQRRLKTLFVEAAPPPPSEGLLARLQGLPGGEPGGGFGNGVFGAVGPDTFGYVPPPPAVPEPDRGFRIHEVARPAPSPARGRRFAFAAAGAVSLAAIALGGALPLEAAVDPNARNEGGTAVTPVSRTGSGYGGTLSVAEAERLGQRGRIVPIGRGVAPLPVAAPTATGHILPGALLADDGGPAGPYPAQLPPVKVPVFNR